MACSKQNCVLGSVSKCIARRSREGIILLCSVLSRPHLEYCLALIAVPERHKNLENIQQRATEKIRDLENLTYEERSKEEGYKNSQSDGTPLLWGKAERIGVVQPEKEKAARRPSSSLPVPEVGPTRKLERDFLQGHVVIELGGMVSSWNRVYLD